MNETTGSNRPSKSGHGDDKYPYVKPKDLGGPEHLAVDAEDVEDFIEHFEHHDEHEKAHAAKRQAEAKASE